MRRDIVPGGKDAYDALFCMSFPQKSPIISGCLAGRDLQLQASCASLPSCMSHRGYWGLLVDNKSVLMRHALALQISWLLAEMKCQKHTHTRTRTHTHSCTHTYTYTSYTHTHHIHIHVHPPTRPHPVTPTTHPTTHTHTLSLAHMQDARRNEMKETICDDV